MTRSRSCREASPLTRGLPLFLVYLKQLNRLALTASLKRPKHCSSISRVSWVTNIVH
jgi:hypothetical protein